MSTEIDNRESIRLRLESIFQDVFSDDSISISDCTKAADIDDWDSLMHITLVVNIEKAFHIRFNIAELGILKNVGDLLTLIEKRCCL